MTLTIGNTPLVPSPLAGRRRRRRRVPSVPRPKLRLRVIQRPRNAPKNN